MVVTDPEATQRYRRKIEKDDNYINCVMSTATVRISSNLTILKYLSHLIDLPMLLPALGVVDRGDGTRSYGNPRLRG